MDPLIGEAARRLAAGDLLGALGRVALRRDAPALALRGIVMAQLGEFDKARLLLREAAAGFSTGQPMARARCVVAQAEVALVSRDLSWPARGLLAAGALLEAGGDHVNAAHARQIEARRLLLLGRLDDAERLLADDDDGRLPSAARAQRALTAAGIAIRRLRIGEARRLLERARAAAAHSALPALVAEADAALRGLDQPAARRIGHDGDAPLRLDEVEQLCRSATLVVDACRHLARQADTVVPLASRPVLFGLLRELARAWPRDVPREVLATRVFRARQVDDTHRARLRVEIGRLRVALRPLAGLTATAAGFLLVPGGAGRPAASGPAVALLAPPVDSPHADVLALLADGEAWSSAALALVLGSSQRTVQRALDALAAAGTAQPVGRGRARRWLAMPATGFTTALLLPGPLPGQ